MRLQDDFLLDRCVACKSYACLRDARKLARVRQQVCSTMQKSPFMTAVANAATAILMHPIPHAWLVCMGALLICYQLICHSNMMEICFLETTCCNQSERRIGRSTDCMQDRRGLAPRIPQWTVHDALRNYKVKASACSMLNMLTFFLSWHLGHEMFPQTRETLAKTQELFPNYNTPRNDSKALGQVPSGPLSVHQPRLQARGMY